jgi:hypothetical protein
VLAYLDEKGSSPPKGKRAAAAPTTGEATSAPAPQAEPTPKADATKKTKAKRATKAKARHKKSDTAATN